MINISKDLIAFIQKINDETQQKILIVPHINPDGDAIGSAVALYHYFKLHHQVSVVCPSNFPDFLSWLPNVQTFINYQKQEKQAQSLVAKADIILIIDHNATDRSGDLEPFIAQSKAVKIMIDHHPKPSYPVDYSLSCTEVSSTAELVYQLISSLDTSAFNQHIATGIYTGIMTDTGNFVHNLHPNTFQVVSELMKLKIDRDDIYDRVFNNFSFDRMRMMGYALLEKTVLLKDIGVAIISLSNEEMQSFNFTMGDTEGFVNLPLSSKEVKASILILEKEDGIRYSFRSKGDISINQIAKQYFNGGGHKNAAGGTDSSSISLEESVQKLTDILYQEKALFL